MNFTEEYVSIIHPLYIYLGCVLYFNLTALQL